MSDNSVGYLEVGLTRRQLLRLGAAGGVVLLLAPPGWSFAPSATEAGPLTPFLSESELALVEAASARIIPTDSLPGAREAGVADYIQGLLSQLPFVDANCDGQRSAADFTALLQRQGTSASEGCPGADVNGDGTVDGADLQSAEPAFFDARPVFAGGPFSGRQPFGDFASGEITATFPAPSVDNFIPLTRLQRLSWKVRLDGATGVPELADNPLASSLPDVNLRARYRAGLAQLDQMSQSKFSKAFLQLSAAQQDQILSATANAAFVGLLTRHTFEGLMCDPVYGGNRDRIGWQLVGFDGDSQPLGYTLGFDEGTQQYIERPDKPNSRPNPGEKCEGFTETMTAFLSAITSLSSTISAEPSPNMVFPDPYCFGV